MSEWIKWVGGFCPVNENLYVDAKNEVGEVRNVKAKYVDWRITKDYRLTNQQSMEEAYEQAHKPISDSALDSQVSGTHYKKLKIQPVTYIHANNIGFMEGSAIKYLSRWRDKGGVDDLQKAKHFIEMLIELEGK